MSIHVSGDASFFKAPLPEGGLPTPATIGCAVLRDNAVLWSVPFRSQHSATPPTDRLNDNNPVVMQFSICCQARVESWTHPKTAQLMIGGRMSTIGVLPRAMGVSIVTTVTRCDMTDPS